MKTDGSRLKALVPVRSPTFSKTSLTDQGCGKGYDPAMLALHGFDAYGLEISPIGARTAESYTAAQMKDPLPHNFGSKEYANSRPGAGHAEIITGDFFSTNWLSDRGIEAFDIVYDYTVSFISPLSFRMSFFPYLLSDDKVSLRNAAGTTTRLGATDGRASQARRVLDLSRISSVQRQKPAWTAVGSGWGL